MVNDPTLLLFLRLLRRLRLVIVRGSETFVCCEGGNTIVSTLSLIYQVFIESQFKGISKFSVLHRPSQGHTNVLKKILIGVG